MEAEMNLVPEIERTTEVPAEPADVWNRIIDGEWSIEWLGIRIDPRRGGSVDVPDRDVIGEVERVDPGRSITWVWRERSGSPSEVTITLHPGVSGTTVRVVERMIPFRMTEYPPIQMAA